MGNGGGGGHPSPKLGRHMFRIFDTNSDGQVSFVELVLALHVMKRGSAEDNLRRIFRLFDINSDGEISRKELEKIVKHLGDEEEEDRDNVARTAFDEKEFVSACLTRRRKTSTELATKIASIFVAEGGPVNQDCLFQCFFVSISHFIINKLFIYLNNYIGTRYLL